MPSVDFWSKQLALAHKKEEKFRKKANEIYRLYRDDRGQNELEDFRFNILWANTETQRPALFSSTPVPDVRRRISRHFDQLQNEEISKFSSIMIERSLEFMLDPGNGLNFEPFGQKCVSDFLLPGRAVAKVDYVPTIGNTKRRVDLEEVEGRIEENGKEVVDFERDDKGFFRLEDEEDVVWEEVTFTRYSHNMFRMDPSADCWEDVDWVAFGTLMTRTSIDNQPEFEADATKVPLNFNLSGEQLKDAEKKENKGKFALVWQIWSKPDKKVYPVVEGMDVFLDSGKEEGGTDDPLNLQNFFPCPEPAYALPDPETLIPTPEFRLYQDQAREIDRMTARIAALITMLKAVGIYAGEDKAVVSKIKDAVDGDLIPVADWRAMLEKGGISGVIDWLPINDIRNVVQTLIAERADLIRQVFELTGISDIQRGATDARETKGAQVIKANFATRRLLPKQQAIQRFFRDLYRMAGELIVEKFDPRMIAAMTALPLETEEPQQAEGQPPQQKQPSIRDILPIMRQDALRSFRVDIETDSTVAVDDQREKEGIAEFISAISRMFTSLGPLIQAAPGAAPAVGAIILEAAKRFKFSREVEDQLRQVIQSSQQQQQQDPEAQAKAQEAQAKQQQMQQDEARKNAEFQLEMQETLKEIQRKDAETNAKIAKIATDIKNKNAESAARQAKIASV